MKKIFVFFLSLTAFQVSAQVSTLPNSIGIGNGTDPNVPFHINKSISEQIRLQGTTPYISFYEGATAKAYLQGFSGGIALGSYGTNDVHLYTGFTPRLTVLGTNGFVGINKSNPSQPLDVAGNLQFSGTLRPNGQTGGLNQFLMSTGGSSAPQWTTISENPQVGFRGFTSVDFTIPFNTIDVVLNNLSQAYDDGGDNFNPTTGVFTAPSAGLYHFAVQLPIVLNTSLANNKLVADLYVNNSLFQRKPTVYTTSDSYPNNLVYIYFQKLASNDQVQFKVFQVNTLGAAITVNQNFEIVGYKVY